MRVYLTVVNYTLKMVEILFMYFYNKNTVINDFHYTVPRYGTDIERLEMGMK